MSTYQANPSDPARKWNTTPLSKTAKSIPIPLIIVAYLPVTGLPVSNTNTNTNTNTGQMLNTCQ